jgi:hypothetical protein
MPGPALRRASGSRNRRSALMSPDRLGPPAYRAVGGEVVSLSGRAVSDAEALRLIRRLGRAAMLLEHSSGAASGRCCALIALELASAMTAAHDWRRAASDCFVTADVGTAAILKFVRAAKPNRNS